MLGEVGAAQLARRDVERDAPGRARRARHASRWRQSASSTHSPTSLDQPVSSANGMNSPGAHEAALGIVPAHERLEPAHAAVARLDDRLEVQDELVALDRAAQAGRQRQALARLVRLA